MTKRAYATLGKYFSILVCSLGLSMAPSVHRADAEPSDDSASFLTAPPSSGKSIGHTSVVFKVRLENGREGAYKPQSHRGKGRYRGEIAAYRLGQALSLPNVPRAFPRPFAGGALRAALDPTARALFDEEVILDRAGQVQGAMIPWITKLEFLPLEKKEWRARWQRWLTAGAEIEDRKMAAQIGTLVAFDYLTGNWDRWSGGNVGYDRATETVLFIDNDGAFFDPPPPGPLARQKGLLQKVDRFSRGFVAKLRALDPEATRAALGEEATGTPLLSASVLTAMEARRKTILAIVDAKLQARPDDTLVFE